MEVQQLSAETFKSLKELAEVQSQISMARAELLNLKKEHETYLTEREKDIVKRVSCVLETSREALSEADKNRDALGALLSEARRLVRSIQELGSAINSESNAFQKSCGEIFADIDSKTELLRQAKEELIARRREIDSERGILEKEKEAFGRERARILDITNLTNKKIERLKQNKI